MNLLTDDPTLGAAGPSDYQSLSSGWALGTAAAQAWDYSGFASMQRGGEQYEAGYGQLQPGYRTTVTGPMQHRTGPDTPLLEPDAANERFGIPGQLSWDKPVREDEANLLNQWKRQEIQRGDILDRSTPGAVPAVARFMAGMGASVIDPVNVAASFIPVFGEARWAALAGKVGIWPARLARGAGEGFVGSALVEPITAAQQISQQGDYDWNTAILDIGFGTIGGIGFHALGGAFHDVALRWKGAPMEARATAFMHSVDAMTEGRPIRAAEIAEPARVLSRREQFMSGTTLTPIERDAIVPPDLRASMNPLDHQFEPVSNPLEALQVDRQGRVEQTARTMNPEAWSTRDQLLEQRDTLRAALDAETTARGQSLPDADAKIAYAKGRAESAPTYKERQLFQREVERLYAERYASDVADYQKSDTPKMAEIRAQLLKTDEGLRDLAPHISETLRKADGDTPQPTMQDTKYFNQAQGDPGLVPEQRRAPTLDDMLAETMGSIRRDATGEGGASDDAVGLESSRRAAVSVAESVPPERMPDEAKVRAIEAQANFQALVKDAESRGEKVATAEVDAEIEKAGIFKSLKQAASLLSDCMVTHGV